MGSGSTLNAEYDACMCYASLNSKNFTGLIVANGNPIGLRCTPLNLIYFTLSGRIREYWIFDCSRHLLNVPDKRLMIIPGRTDVTRTKTSAMS